MMQVAQRHFNAHAFVNMAMLLDVDQTGLDGHKGLHVQAAHVSFGFDQMKGIDPTSFLQCMHIVSRANGHRTYFPWDAVILCVQPSCMRLSQKHLENAVACLECFVQRWFKPAETMFNHDGDSHKLGQASNARPHGLGCGQLSCVSTFCRRGQSRVAGAAGSACGAGSAVPHSKHGSHQPCCCSCEPGCRTRPSA